MDDDMPELEDFSEELKNIRDKTGKTDKNDENTNISVKVVEDVKQPVLKQNTNQQVTTNTTTNTTTSSSKKNDGELSFMKKGFFKRQAEKETKGVTTNTNSANNNSQSNTQLNTQSNQNNNKDIVDLTHIKNTNPDQKKDLIINEVQKEMNSGLGSNIMNKKDEWLNPELMQKIAKNPKLLQYMLDPKFMEVILIILHNNNFIGNTNNAKRS